jgi:hypothetical protein
MTDLRISIARDIRAILSLHANLPNEAAHRAYDRELPGGDALVMHGPAANLQAWEHQVEAAEAAFFAGDRGWLDLDDNDADPQPALLVLAYWEDKIRDERNQPTDLRATVRRASDYLLSQIDYLVQQYLSVEELARDLRALRTRLESVLKDGIRPDRGVPCMRCGRSLIKVWGADAMSDRWHCKPCDEWSTIDQYNLAIQAHYRANADKLTASDILLEYRIPTGTLRSWAARGDVRKRGRDDSGRMLYDVADTLAARDAGAVA